MGSFSGTGKLERGNDHVANVEEEMTRKEIEIGTVRKQDRTGKISMNSWNGMLNQPFEEKLQLGQDYLKLNPIWRLEDGNSKIPIQPCMSLIESSNLKDYTTSGESMG